MTDPYRIDSHKLIFHPDRVAQWAQAGNDWEEIKTIFPIYLEVSPTGACNHRCVFCALDYLGYKPRMIDADIMTRFEEMARHGVKSIMFAGEGEPLLHRRFYDLTAAADEAGIDLALTSNGVLMDARFREELLRRFVWIKVSLNAGTASTYAAIHGTQEADFRRVVLNLKSCVATRNDLRLNVTLGIQILLLPENAAEVVRLARICRDEIGADYLVVKPYSQHFLSSTRRYAALDYSDLESIRDEIEKLESPIFRVIFRAHTMRKLSMPKSYQQCLSTPIFWAYVMASGDLYSCSAYLGDKRFCLGNLNSQSFEAIWQSERRHRNFGMMRNGLDIKKCRINCRMDEINRYLWELAHPAKHVNFI
jgi:cyclic pyranopterin phosphate synthase